MTTIAEYLDITSGTRLEKRADIFRPMYDSNRTYGQWGTDMCNNATNAFNIGKTGVGIGYNAAKENVKNTVEDAGLWLKGEEGIKKDIYSDPAKWWDANPRHQQEAFDKAYSTFSKSVNPSVVTGTALKNIPQQFKAYTDEIQNGINSNPGMVTNWTNSVYNSVGLPVNSEDVAKMTPQQRRAAFIRLVNMDKTRMAGKDVVDANVKKNIAGDIAGMVIGNRDLIPDTAVPEGMTESQYLGTSTFGDQDVFKNRYQQFYDPKNPTKTNSGGYAMLKDIANNKEMAQLAAYNYMKMTENERKNSPLYLSLTSLAQEMARMGKFDESAKILEKANKLSSSMGTLDGNMFGPETIGDYLQEYANDALGQIQNYHGENQDFNPFQKTLDTWNKQYDANKITTEQQNQIHDYWQKNIADNRMKHNFYGVLGDPGMQQAFQYAAPWLTYGTGVAGVGSMLGNNALWPIVGMGAIGSGLYGMGNQKGWYGQINPQLQKGIQNVVGGMNGFIGNAAKSFLPKGMHPFVDSSLGTTTQPTSTTATPASNTTSFNMTQQSQEWDMSNFNMGTGKTNFNKNLWNTNNMV